MVAGRSKDSDAVRITTAGVNRSDEIDGRVRTYLVSMTVRAVCFGAAVLVGPGVLRWVLVAGAVLLPYVAVVMANAVDTRNNSQGLDRVVTDPELEGRGTRMALEPPRDERPGVTDETTVRRPDDPAPPDEKDVP